MYNPLKYFRNRKVGLALGSGGSKGMAHIAVLEYMEFLGIPVHMIAGSSIGAVIGAVYACGNLRAFKRDILGMDRKEVFSFFDPVFPRHGFLEGRDWINFMKKYIPPDAMIEDLPLKMSIMATDVLKGTSVVFNSGNILEAVRASSSVPGVFVPVRYGDTFLIDGGVANPLPVDVVKTMGAGLTIAVNLHPGIGDMGIRSAVKDSVRQDRPFHDSGGIEIVDEGQSRSTDEMKQTGLIKSIEKFLGIEEKDSGIRPPGIFDIITRTIDTMEYMNTMLMLRYNSPTVLVEPDVIQYGTLDFDKSGEIITRGFKACSDARKALIKKVKNRL